MTLWIQISFKRSHRPSSALAASCGWWWNMEIGLGSVAPRDAADTACRVPRQAVPACLRPQRPCKVNESEPRSGACSTHGHPGKDARATGRARLVRLAAAAGTLAGKTSPEALFVHVRPASATLDTYRHRNIRWNVSFREAIVLNLPHAVSLGPLPHVIRQNCSPRRNE